MESEGEGSPLAGSGEEKHEAGSGIIRFEAKAAKLAGIEVSPARVVALQTSIAVNGQIAANPDGVVRVSSVVPGRVTKLPASQGTKVSRGQVLAVVESRAIGEAQAAYQQASARLTTAKTNFDVVLSQVKAGVFANAPLEAARRTQTEARAEVETQNTAVKQNQISLDSVVKLARAGSFARPALETARNQFAAAEESVQKARAAAGSADAAVESAQSELARRRQIAATGGYGSRPVDEARRALVSAQSAKNAAQSEVTTVKANLARLNNLLAEGLVAKREVEAAQASLAAGQARFESAGADVAAAQAELERQQKLAAANVTATAEVQSALGQLAAAQADANSRRAEVARAEAGLRLTKIALDRETAVAQAEIANRREISTARANLQNSRTALMKTRESLELANAALAREQKIHRQNLNNVAQVQSARAAVAMAETDFRSAGQALALLKSAPGGAASIEIRAPISGVIQERNVTRGETVTADEQLFTIVNLETVALDAALYEKDLSEARVGTPITVTVDALPGQSFKGIINFIGSQLDEETRTLTARAIIRNPGALRPGLFARGQLKTGTGAMSVAVPKDAVQSLEDKAVVFVPRTGERSFVAREVSVGTTAEGLTAIRTGLKPGELVVSKGAFVVKSQAMKSELAEE